jgi:hypothetical protein
VPGIKSTWIHDMTNIRLDQVDFSTLFESPQNYASSSQTLSISGTLNAFSQRVFLAAIPYTRAGTRADLYATGNNIKMLANAGSRAIGDIYQFAGSETINLFISYSSTQISIAIVLANGSASPINLTTQDIVINAVMYDMPISATS